jgi:hypothetical protein
MTAPDRLRTALAARGRHLAALGARLDGDTLPAAMVALARELVGDDGWRFVVGETDSLVAPSARRSRR